MNKGRLVTALALSVAIATALAQTADAFGGRGGRGGGGGFRGRPSGFQQPGFNAAFMGSQPGFNSANPGGYNRSFPGLDSLGPNFLGFPGFAGSNRGFKGQGGLGAFAPWGTTTVWGAPADYGYGYGYVGPAPMIVYAPQYYAPAYVPPPPYPPQVGGSISMTPVPPASVVSFPSGRYELRGDGSAAPYQWVWVPNSPAAPPPPPTAPPAPPEQAPGQPPPSADDGPARRSQLYRWTDEQGVVHWTNRAEAVPAKYRTQAKYDPSS